MASIKQLLQTATATLSATSDSSALDVQVLLQHVLQQPRSYLYAHPDYVLTTAEFAQLQQLLVARAMGQPIAYLTGAKEFWSLSFRVSTDVLIPRPETELLVVIALKLLNADSKLTVADWGTGSGAIACALQHEHPHWRIDALDISTAALAVARQNARQLGCEQIQFIESDWAQALTHQRYQAIIANPPYVAADDPHLQSGDVRFEPGLALIAATAGLAAIERIMAAAPAHLSAPGYLLFEHGASQAHAVQALFQRYGFVDYHCLQDLAGHDRVSYARYPVL